MQGIIGIVDKNGKYKIRVCETNAQLGFTGLLLDCFYKDTKKIKRLMTLGSIELLGVDVPKQPLNTGEIVRNSDYRIANCFYTMDGKNNGRVSYKPNTESKPRKKQTPEETPAEPTVEDIKANPVVYLWDTETETWGTNNNGTWVLLHELLLKHLQTDYMGDWESTDAAQYIDRIGRYKEKADKKTVMQIEEIQTEFQRFIWDMLGGQEEEKFVYDNFLFSNRVIGDRSSKEQMVKILKADKRKGVCTIEQNGKTEDRSIGQILLDIMKKELYSLTNPSALKGWRQFEA